MIPPQSLGALAGIHELLAQLVEDFPPADCNRRFHPQLPTMGWLFGRATYLELYWLRERLLGDDDLSRRVRHLFAGTETPSPAQEAALPPRDHLLNWALEIQDHDLSLLANPGRLPADHPWLRDGWLVDYLVQRLGLIYERMLAVRLARAQHTGGRPPGDGPPLAPEPPNADALEISQGHYRIGARDGVVMDNEQPLQVVELRNFRIQRRPVSCANWLAFIEAGGYAEARWWPDPQCAARRRGHPWSWRRDQDRWYALGFNGPMPLAGDQPVSCIDWHEASAFANWAAETLPDFKGAVLPHEYHWEAAARLGALEETGRVWEWCAEPLHPYQDYETPRDPEMATRFDPDQRALRGGCIHTQPRLRRPSLRHQAPPDAGWCFAGLRLMLPPALEDEALYHAQWQRFLN